MTCSTSSVWRIVACSGLFISSSAVCCCQRGKSVFGTNLGVSLSWACRLQGRFGLRRGTIWQRLAIPFACSVSKFKRLFSKVPLRAIVVLSDSVADVCSATQFVAISFVGACTSALEALLAVR
jgi:hypothetical protein